MFNYQLVNNNNLLIFYYFIKNNVLNRHTNLMNIRSFLVFQLYSIILIYLYINIFYNLLIIHYIICFNNKYLFNIQYPILSFNIFSLILKFYYL